ncbi:Dimethylaniline monooxygenase [N-oxide-forming] 2 [Araneus ventricosus]|uniref:Flavin-containing monooxygenase n=1 Tax=Araneus ventricosus TaxID=182803 RepID=A0A4Y2MK46_ARAVE|nr:Dimethylaniline monooxygenase [N-oxide-forming] 2 [Araneus ventricosus]
MDTPIKRIAIIGGGYAGLSSIWTLLEEGGFEPVCFEKTDKPGGTWCYRKEVMNGVPSIMPTTITNHSKEMGAVSNWPPPKESSIFMRHNEIYQYVLDIAKSRGALKHILYNMEVIKVKRADDYEESGRWSVTVRNTVTEQASTDVFDGVLVCVGHFNRPKMPSYPGQELYKNHIIHTHSLKEVEPYRNKTVVVVGMGCSGLDAAVEISSIAKQVYLSTRSGAHVLHRAGPNGYPMDYSLLRRWLYILLYMLPPQAYSWLLESVFADPQFNQNMYAVKPQHHILSKEPVINDCLASKLLSGLVKQVPDIQAFTEDGVIFEGDTEVTKTDVVIMGTGYTWEFPFLEEDILVHEQGRFNLYKCMYPVNLHHGTLSFIGFVLPFGPGFPIAELQIRWATQVLAGNCKLPSKEVMLQDVLKRHSYNVARYAPSEKISIRIDIIQYCDDVASQIGAKPNFIKVLLTDPKLFLKLVFGPSLPYQYRLQGPHSWDGAREAIMTCEERLFYPLKKMSSMEPPENIFLTILKKILRALVL